jgi:hypothetical protein
MDLQSNFPDSTCDDVFQTVTKDPLVNSDIILEDLIERKVENT